jgi:hypothetical protein
MKFIICNLVFSVLICLPHLNGVTTKDSNLGGNIEENRGPIFVSLGSACKTAHMQRECGIRTAAFPFDWIVSFDGEKLIELLEENFLHFLNPDFLKVSGQALLNEYYHLEFLNEGDWEDAEYNIKIFILKCQRRINRFIQLKGYQGKVFFVRSANPFSVSDPHRIWRIKENIEITGEYAARLYQTLKNFFPSLDFELIIMNDYKHPGFSREVFSDHILMVNIENTIDVYKDFYKQLLLEQGISE